MKGLRITLWVCAVYCLLGFVLAALPWGAITAFFHWVGVQPPAGEPIVIYMIRLALMIGGMIGVFFAILARNPLQYGAMLLLAAYGLLCCGFCCLIGGIGYALPVWMYASDVLLGIGAGALLLAFRNQALSTPGD